VTGAPSEALLTVRERLAIAAHVIGPILNRVVLAGPPVAELLVNDPAIRLPRVNFAADSVLQLLSTSMVDRLGLDLEKLGLTRTGRAVNADRWRVDGGVTLDLVQVRPDDADPAQVWLEYATLLTLPFTVGDRIVVRIASAPAMLAIECASFAASGVSALDSEELERVVLLIAGRTEIEHEFAGAPPELRSIIASSLARVAESDALSVLIRRALPDAGLLPAVARRVQARILRMAG
jgi:hypothetical protein